VIYDHVILVLKGRIARCPERAAITALLGANGAGKTTTLESDLEICFISERGEVTKGSIVFDGEGSAGRASPNELVRARLRPR